MLSVGCAVLGNGQEFPDLAARLPARGLYACIADACMTNTQSVPGIPADGIPGGSRKVTEAPACGRWAATPPTGH